MQERDYQWFLENYTNLFEKYGDSYLVIKNKQVLGVYPTYGAGVKSMEGKEELGTFIVQRCDGRESGYTNFISSMNFITC